MAIVVGTHVFGRIENRDGSRDATRFFHIAHFPVLPVGSAYDDRPLSWRSVGVAYARLWGLLGLVIAFFLMLEALDKAVSPGAVIAATLPMTLLGWLVAIAWVIVGRPRLTNSRLKHRTLLAVVVLGPLALFALFTTLSIQDIPKIKAQLDARR